jgi:HlyD family secretion protein
MQSPRVSAPVSLPQTLANERRGSRWWLWAIAIVVLIGLGVGGYLYFRQTRPVRPSYTTVPVVKGSVLGTVNSTGQIAPWTSAKLAFELPGRIASVSVKVGDSVKKGDPIASLDTTQLSILVRQQESALAAAKAKLALVQAGPRPEDISAAQAALDGAQAKLDGMLAQGRPEDVSTAQAALDGAQAKLDGMLAQGRPADVQAAQEGLNAAQAKLHGLKQGPQAGDVAAAQTAVQAAQAAVTLAQAQLAALTRPPDPLAIKQAQNVLEQAKDAVNQRQLQRDGFCGDPNIAHYQCQQAQSQIGQAEQAEQQAQAKLDQLSVPPHPEDVAAANAAVASAQANVTSAQARLAQLKAGALPDDIAQASAAVGQAEQALEAKKTPWTQSDIDQQKDLVAQAAAALAIKQTPWRQADIDQQKQLVAQAAAALARAKQPFTANDVAQAQAVVDGAQAQLDQARYNVSAATVLAPFSGIVSAVSANPGELASPISPSPIVSLVDPNNLRLDASVDETDVSHVQVGQDVTIAFDAVPDKTFPGKVLSIAPNATVQSGVATYTVSVSVQSSPEIKPGMTGNASIIYAHHDDVLLVPNRAVRTDGANRVVSVLASGTPVAKPVTVGISDDQSTEVLTGVQVGDQVVLPSTSTVPPAFANGGVR